MITYIGGRSMLAMWRSSISGGSILGMALCCQLRIYQTLGTITLDGIGISFCLARQTDDVQPSCCRPWEPVPDCGACVVKKGARKLPCGRERGSSVPVPPLSGRRGHIDPGRGGDRVEGSGGRGRRDLGSSDHGFSSFQAPPRGLGFSSFQAPPPLGTVGSSTLHMSISYASSFNSDEHDDEWTNDVKLALQLGFGHRFGKKTTRVL
ncbi:hypothetical protein M9H77_17502 [Catharanthus roseus]|uniref:Uncharacterized protein n=1 Tax=Catharanthus roseus TaxID=4058 RepID=A0ACC0B4T3_CATRO|nr:hypothetical protein M9H77_17502 [Catharanthus roseus]